MTPEERERLLNEAFEKHLTGDDVKATELIKQVLDYDVNDAPALHLLAQISHKKGNFDIARDLFQASLKLDPEQGVVWSHLGSVLNDLRDPEGAEKALLKALELDPKLARAYKFLADIYLNQGEKEKGIEYLKKGIEANPGFMGTYLPYAMYADLKPGDPFFENLEKILENNDGDKQKKMMANYALSYVYQKMGDQDTFFKHLHSANELARDPDNKWRENIVNHLNKLKENITKEFLSKKVSETKKLYTPIFIVGMPRSGTSLTDQIFATHSQCFGGDELQYFPKYLGRVALATTGKDNIEALSLLEMEHFERIAELYQRRVQQLAPGYHFISDKMPWNFRNIGLISKILPWAKIIHIHRDPLDCGFSCYRNPLSKNIEFSCGMEDYAFYRKNYQDIMDFWGEITPESFINVKYEDLVNNPETELKRILDYCGLPWEDNLLEFHATKRQVRTLSSDQVNKPLYKDSIGKAWKYEKELAPMINALREYNLLPN